jgi:Phosphotransferase enzyme family
MGPRTVSVVLHRPRGALPPFTVASPWWPEVEPVVEGVRERYGIDVVVLRLLAAREWPGGPVTYLAELRRGDPSAFLSPWPDPLAEDDLRLPYARPGGPGADLAWADQHVTLKGAPVQVKTWNLSSIWRLPTAAGPVWLKHVPPFFAHEPFVLDALGPDAPVPPVLAGEPGRMLLADVPGYDCYDATEPQLAAMVDALVDLQLAVGSRTAGFLEVGVADWRAPAFQRLAADVIDRDAPEDHADVLRRLLDDIPARFAALEECGLPDVLVHGDFHPGNVRWSGDGPVLLDWGDCGIGHPMFDFPAFLQRAGSAVEALRRRWLGRWAAAWPGSEPERAATVIEPLAALRLAIVYRGFLDGIEQSEQVYHRDDVATWLRQAALLTRSPPEAN